MTKTCEYKAAYLCLQHHVKVNDAITRNIQSFCANVTNMTKCQK